MMQCCDSLASPRSSTPADGKEHPSSVQANMVVLMLQSSKLHHVDIHVAATRSVIINIIASCNSL